jgi:ribonucleases P/MRP protein subunit RPP40
MPLFEFDSAGRREPKTYVHVGHLPASVHPEHSPTKRSPWRMVSNAPFLKSVNLILPKDLYAIIWDKIEDETKKACYTKVILKLQDLLDGAFFTEYIKKGNASSSSIWSSCLSLLRLNGFCSSNGLIL